MFPRLSTPISQVASRGYMREEWGDKVHRYFRDAVGLKGSIEPPPRVEAYPSVVSPVGVSEDREKHKNMPPRG